MLFGCEGGKFLSLRLASISNLSLLLGLEPLKKFLVVVGGGGGWWVVESKFSVQLRPKLNNWDILKKFLVVLVGTW